MDENAFCINHIEALVIEFLYPFHGISGRKLPGSIHFTELRWHDLVDGLMIDVEAGE